ncbi:MAG: prepilin-type N-terminal cleavage/methylation domain-containing protein [Xanthomonadales bacterium]|nr:prepilin-type N-terminal cleavage/methylation domain-containing protein [Gammaproteobacteria bacterium]MBT8054355.1 prepilin-type N-terminal cleavage/methylation domain-containing protein [Gammaproteobacteria bacterium]NND56481.1 prepilin-type N-terminal cleavage/methylation domain-containing protein [Xanthomonadales bacterium]NNK51176.1 prepilin-type N-terminal cleavage/methylation domain-containing protein [Xanthomonadales bacterium]
MMNSSIRTHGNRGFTLIEVLIGILIFALGMMALAQLQGHLARNSGDSNARTVATNIAEEIIERARVFGQITSDGTNAAYNDIIDSTDSITRAGNNYTVVTDVTDYYWDAGSGAFTTTVPASAGRSDFKRIDLTVTWNSGQEFKVDATTTTSGRLGSGSVRISDVVSSITSAAGGKAIIGSAGNSSYTPPVNYNPGANPDIISIQLGDNKFKESTTPLPDVIRTDELVETTFDVVTYSQSDTGATFLRREEFRAVSCVCTLEIPSSSDEGGLRPTIWDGYDYTEGEFVSKPYGTSANNQQSQYCDICCRDHHDGGTGENDDPNDPGRSLYAPFRSAGDYHADGALDGDHKHYNRGTTGELTLADTDGATYVEACRMVRKDGFWRIAQDLRQEGLNSFPGDHLDSPEEVGEYSDYVTAAVSAYEAAVGATDLYELNPPSLTRPADMATPVIFPASTLANPTNFASSGTIEQQLRARGIYLDYLSDTLRTRINCLDAGGTGDDCEVPDVNSALEIIPFYDVQLTWLSRWNETPNNNPIDVTNEAIADDNSHDRGIATLQLGFGFSTISSAVHTGNLGLTGTDPIDPWYTSEEESYNLYALAQDFSTPPPLSGIIVSGSITSAIPGVKAADVEIEASGAACDRTNTGYECVIEAEAVNPRLKVSNYFKPNQVLVACAAGLTVHGTEHSGTNRENNWTRFDLPDQQLLDANIVIKRDSCN